MDQRQFVVETNLNAPVDIGRGKLAGSYTVHARTRRVERPKEPDLPKVPELGDPWCPLTVRARLHRFAEVFRRLPHTPDTKPGGYRSCMPEVVREVWKDQPKDGSLEFIKLAVDKTDRQAAFQLLSSFVSFKFDREKMAVWWGIANKLSDRRVGREIHRSHPHVAKLKIDLLNALASRWNEAGWVPEEADIVGARKLIHRNLD